LEHPFGQGGWIKTGAVGYTEGVVARFHREGTIVPRFGAHLSIAGGLHHAVESALELGCETVQLFTKNASQWAGKPLVEEEVQRFRTALQASTLTHATAHDSYLINLASPDEALWNRSLAAFIDEVRRADRLGLDYLVTHPGAHMGEGDDAGLERVARAIDETHAQCPDASVMILLETTAGMGTTLGHRFEHLAAIRRMIAEPERVGVCVDTCHVLAAGYPLSPVRAYNATWREFDRTIGVEHIRVFHLNDSKKPRGSRVDRHEHIGEGEVGLEAFRLLVNDGRFRHLPMILETPKEDRDGEVMDRVNLARLRGLIGQKKKAS
jgi:deoxyribonuclease-4